MGVSENKGKPKTTFLLTNEKDIRQSTNYARFLEKEGWIVETLDDGFVYIKKIWKLGLGAKYQRPTNPSAQKFVEISRRQKCLYMLFEPLERVQVREFKKRGFSPAAPSLPSKTLLLSLKSDIESIYKGFSKDARYAIRKTNKTRLTEVGKQDYSNLADIWRKKTPPGRYCMSETTLKNLKDSFDRDMFFVSDKDFYAFAIFLKSGEKAYYWQAFTSPKARRLLIQYRLVFEGIKWAQKKGVKVFDFEGIEDERFKLKNWRGFSKFKKKFGATPKEYPQALSKITLSI